jgi:hypothetical protein
VTSAATGGVFRQAISLTVAIAVGWVVCFWPARLLRGDAGILWMSIAAVCCLVPGWLVVLLSRLSVFSNDLAAMLAQMAVRLTLVGAAALMVRNAHPEFGPLDFSGWLVAFYLLALFVEVWLIRSVSPEGDPSDQPGDKA